MEVVEDLLQLEAVLRAQREDDGLLVGRRLQLEAEAHAEALAQGQAPGLVDPRPEGRVDHELHAAALVEEALQDDARLGGDRAQGLPPRQDVLRDLDRPALGQRRAALRAEAIGGLRDRAALVAQAGQLGRQLARPPGGLAQPEGQRGRLALGVGHADDPRLHADHAPRGVPELEDVPAVALHRPVLVDGADERPVRLLPDLVIRGVGDGPAREQRGEARAPRGHEPAVDPVPMEQRAAALGVQRDHLIELLALEVAVGPGAAERGEEVTLRPWLGHAGRHHLLGQDVQGTGRRGRAVQQAVAHAAQERRALDQLVEGQREEPPLGDAGQRVPRAAHPLQEGRDRPRGPDLHHEVHLADVDPQLQRGGGHQRAQPARLQPLLGVQPALAGEAAVVAGDGVLAQQAGEVARDALRHLSGVHEDEAGAVLAYEVGHARVDLLPLLVGADGRERRGRDFDRQVELAEGPGVH